MTERTITSKLARWRAQFVHFFLVRSSLLITILLLAITPLVIALYLNYQLARNILTEQAIHHLHEAMDDISSEIDRYILRQEQNISVIATDPTIINILKNQADALHLPQSDKELLTDYIQYFLDQYGYHSFYLFLPHTETPLISIDFEGQTPFLSSAELTTLHALLNDTTTLMQTEISNFKYLDEPLPNAYIASPVLFENKIIGHVAVQLNSDEIFKRLIARHQLGSSTETILGLKAGDSLSLVVGSDRSLQQIATTAKAFKGELANRLKDAASGEKGYGIITDHTGREVIAVWQYLPSLRGGMLVKVDTKDAFLSIERLRRQVALLAAISIFLLTLIAIYTSNKLKQAEGLLTNIFDSMPSALMLVDNKLRILRSNAQVSSATKLPVSELPGKKIPELFPFLSSLTPTIERIIRSKHHQTLHKIKQAAGDAIHHYDLVIYPLKEKQQRGASVLRLDNIDQRLNLETKMHQNEKLASVGLLTSGIAHEMNNPINFILNSLPPLQTDVDEVLNILDQYQRLSLDQDLAPQLKAIAEKQEELNLQTIRTEIVQLLKSIQDGAQRTAEIVKGLRIFSRMDEQEVKKVNIHEGLDATLALLTHRLKDRIQVVKNYGQIPEVESFAGQLNQCFMNLFSNAIDAIKDKGEIRITTRLKDKDHIQIAIKDSGKGISPSDQEKIFQPFFTTKPVGAGTGLGLSITYGIIHDHGGTIEFTSAPGKGTEFIITLPIHHATTPTAVKDI